VDEISDAQDCDALLQAGWCGVKLLATAHAGALSDLRRRECYRSLLDSRLFTTVVVLRADRQWTVERICL
jgi:stage III sporulation protein AA